MLLIEIYKPSNYYNHVYRSFGVPLKQIWRATSNDFHNPLYVNSYNGTWVSLTPEYSTRYGTDLGTTDTLKVPLLCTFEVSKNILNRPAQSHVGDDDEIPGKTMKLKKHNLKQVIDVKMCIDGQTWIPYNKQVLFNLLHNPSNLQQLLDLQEITVEDCPTPNCITHEQSITSVDYLQQVCPICRSRFGINKLFKNKKDY
jgi:hypothetical protein